MGEQGKRNACTDGQSDGYYSRFSTKFALLKPRPSNEDESFHASRLKVRKHARVPTHPYGRTELYPVSQMGGRATYSKRLSGGLITVNGTGTPYVLFAGTHPTPFSRNSRVRKRKQAARGHICRLFNRLSRKRRRKVDCCSTTAYILCRISFCPYP